MKRSTILWRRNLILFLPVLCIIYLFIISSCASTKTSLFDQLKIPVNHYENPEYALTLDYPADWYFKEQDGLLFASVSSFDIADDGGAGLAVIRLREEDVLKEFGSIILEKVVESFMNEIDSEFGDIVDGMIGGVESRQVEFTILREEKAGGEINILLFKQHVYIFLAVVNPLTLMTKYKQIFRAMYESINFIQEQEQS